MMHFRSKHIADSVTERILAISANIRTGAPIPESKGAATIHLERGPEGDLVVTKSFKNGAPEITTISGTAPTAPVPEGFTDVTPPDEAQPGAETLSDGIDSGNIVQSAALGGDSLDALLRG